VRVGTPLLFLNMLLDGEKSVALHQSAPKSVMIAVNCERRFA